jgi:hypothetical protein
MCYTKAGGVVKRNRTHSHLHSKQILLKSEKVDSNINTVKPIYNEQIGATKKRSLKASFRYNRSFHKEMYAIDENDVLH